MLDGSFISFYCRDQDFEGLNINSDLISDYTAALYDGTNWSQEQGLKGVGVVYVYPVSLADAI